MILPGAHQTGYGMRILQFVSIVGSIAEQNCRRTTIWNAARGALEEHQGFTRFAGLLDSTSWKSKVP